MPYHCPEMCQTALGSRVEMEFRFSCDQFGEEARVEVFQCPRCKLIATGEELAMRKRSETT